MLTGGGAHDCSTRARERYFFGGVWCWGFSPATVCVSSLPGHLAIYHRRLPRARRLPPGRDCPWCDESARAHLLSPQPPVTPPPVKIKKKKPARKKKCKLLVFGGKVLVFASLPHPSAAAPRVPSPLGDVSLFTLPVPTCALSSLVSLLRGRGAPTFCAPSLGFLAL